MMTLRKTKPINAWILTIEKLEAIRNQLDVKPSHVALLDHIVDQFKRQLDKEKQRIGNV